MPYNLPAPHITLTDEEADGVLGYETEYDTDTYTVQQVDVISDNKHETFTRYIIRRKTDNTLWESVHLSGSAYSEWQILDPQTHQPAFLKIDSIEPIRRYSLHGITF